ncbi:hypothetical protein [Rhizobium leguminosarum]|uniref:hypothetical protein n=1 Tax=Rhizobium leguminosarum TaxID=384 RepID=UPI001C905E9B|nr:hypothetical protein [Rhizobium leguminosarum]
MGQPAWQRLQRKDRCRFEFIVGTSTSYTDDKMRIGLRQGKAAIVSSHQFGVYKAEDYTAAFDKWAYFISPTLNAEGSARFATLNTYDRAAFTFGAPQLAAHTPNLNFVVYLRGLLALPNAEKHFPELSLRPNADGKTSVHLADGGNFRDLEESRSGHASQRQEGKPAGSPDGISESLAGQDRRRRTFGRSAADELDASRSGRQAASDIGLHRSGQRRTADHKKEGPVIQRKRLGGGALDNGYTPSRAWDIPRDSGRSCDRQSAGKPAENRRPEIQTAGGDRCGLHQDLDQRGVLNGFQV